MPIEAKKLDAKRETFFDAFFKKSLPEQIREAAEFIARSFHVIIFSREDHPISGPLTVTPPDGTLNSNS